MDPGEEERLIKPKALSERRIGQASIRTAESIGMRFEREYPDEANGTTHVSVIYRYH